MIGLLILLNVHFLPITSVTDRTADPLASGLTRAAMEQYPVASYQQAHAYPMQYMIYLCFTMELALAVESQML